MLPTEPRPYSQQTSQPTLDILAILLGLTHDVLATTTVHVCPAGYVGNWAGPIGAAAAMAVGMFDALPSVASQPTGVWDVVPADLVASSILAAAAAVSAGAAAAISQATQSGAVQGTLEERRVVLGYPHPLSAAVRGVGPQLLGKDRTHDPGDVAARILAKVKLGDSTDSADAGRISPRSDDVSAERDQRPHQHSVLYRSNSSGSSSGSERLLASAVHGGKSEEVTNSSRSSSVTGCECGVQQLAEQQGGVQQQGGMPLLILHSATSSTYPLVLMESWNYMLDFLEAHRAPFRCVLAQLGVGGDGAPCLHPTLCAHVMQGVRVVGVPLLTCTALAR